jgi:beta-galactosidase
MTGSFIAGSYPGGRTLLHFEGAGQTTEVYVYLKKITHHVGGVRRVRC